MVWVIALATSGIARELGVFGLLLDGIFFVSLLCCWHDDDDVLCQPCLYVPPPSLTILTAK